MSERLLILDRDGVINEDSDAYIKSPEEWIPLPGSLEAVARMSRAGFTVVVATNQSGLARGLISEDDLSIIHQHMIEEVARLGGTLNGVFYCPHGPEDDCHCRKPRAGLLRQIEESLDLPVSGSPFVGDSLRDLQAAIAADCRPILVRTGNGERTLQDAERSIIERTAVFDRLSDFVDSVLGEGRGN